MTNLDNRHIAYIVETRFGNYTPILATMHAIERSKDYSLFPKASTISFIELAQAQELLVRHAPAGALVLKNPVKIPPTGLSRVSDLLRATH